MKLSVPSSSSHKVSRISDKIPILVMIFLYSEKVLICQESESSVTSHAIEFNLGSNQIKENILIPKTHKGSDLRLSYLHEKENRNYSGLIFSIGYSRLKSFLETEKATWDVQLNASFSYGKSLLSANKARYYLGANLNYLLGVMEYPVWDESRAYWATVISAGPFNRFELLLNDKTRLISSLCLGIAGLGSRPDEIRLYAQEEWTLSNIICLTNSGFSFITLNNLFICEFKNEYIVSISEKLCFSICNSIIYSTVSERNGHPLQNVRISFGFGFGF